ncbi:MAG: right-handed parallel beta-helix repeat-containing protein, partial [Bacteroidetes bacterium]
MLVTTGIKAQFYIAPNGSDNNPGTKEKPLASLTGARNAIRKNKNTLPKNKSIIVTVLEGSYTMEEPLILNSIDGGTKSNPVIYKAQKGASPVFSGGKQINGFKVNKNDIWEVQIPNIKNQQWKIDQLYVNGNRAVLARTPNKGFLKIDQINENVLVEGTGRAPKRATQTILFDTEDFSFAKNIADNEIKNVRFRTFHHWDFTLRFLDSIDNNQMAIYTTGQGMKPWNPIKKGGRIMFENFKAALDKAGEWFLNDEGILYYIPLPGQTPENTVIIAPVLENLISFNGDAKSV